MEGNLSLKYDVMTSACPNGARKHQRRGPDSGPADINDNDHPNTGKLLSLPGHGHIYLQVVILPSPRAFVFIACLLYTSPSPRDRSLS
eukprot:4304734-Pyramimonas_sp.AAC.1